MDRCGDSDGPGECEVRRSEQGFTLIEILFALLIFSIVAVGTLGFLGAASTGGGFLDAFPTSFAGARFARDYTAASVYLQALQEFVAASCKPTCAEASSPVSPASYMCTPPANCSPSLTGAPMPSGQPTGQTYQLNWQQVNLLVQRWGWNGTAYVSTSPCTSDCLTLVQSTLTWQFKTQTRTLTVQRFVR